jgi:3-dehydrotetronate 4-kinase
MYLGAIADDVTGGTDLASVLRRRGHSVIQTVGVPRSVPSADAIVISLKTRTAPRDIAVRESLAAAALLTDSGACQIYFKYCSTFDSTNEGNIGPVIEALLKHVGSSFTVACPSYPRLRRTVYLGNLFVGEQLLSESSMRDHPLTPMTDSNLVRVLAKQCGIPVGLIPLSQVEAGVSAIETRFAEETEKGTGVAIIDALFDEHVEWIGAACRDLKLVTGGAALGAALLPDAAMNVRNASPSPAPLLERAIVLSGSCSTATLEQICRLKDLIPSRAIDPVALSQSPGEMDRLIDWACDRTRSGRAMLFSSNTPEEVHKIKASLGKASAELLENVFGAIAKALSENSVRTFVIGGGETSGAVLKALGIKMLGFGDEIEPGVPWTFSLDPQGFHLALKSGNFGGPDFFAKALGMAR